MPDFYKAQICVNEAHCFGLAQGTKCARCVTAGFYILRPWQLQDIVSKFLPLFRRSKRNMHIKDYNPVLDLHSIPIAIQKHCVQCVLLHCNDVFVSHPEAHK